MLDILFEDDDMEVGNSGDTNHRGRPPGPPPPRNSTGLVGIDNQGATCYLNSLLQTLMLTPELRESLFQLGPDELGKLSDRDVPGAKVRVIPIQLQRLFARLLYLDQESCSSKDLTDSFGWNNSEHAQQHDVQELNRILFSAIEDSLIGTSGQTVISELYHGKIVNKIICQRCGRVSEREEDFLDLTLPITGMVGVSDSLRSMYTDVELMTGSNQYRCSSCQVLVDAKKGAKVRKLPPILTVSLLRFSYDFQKGERYKETGHYTFPLELDMGPYCEQVPDGTDGIYQLFSVVIHSGSSHGGHYHAYIRDVDDIGNWTPPENAPIVLKSDPQEGKVDFIEISSPQQLIKTLLQQHGESMSLPIDKLCQVLMKETGVSWNKRFKKQYGPIMKFLRKYDDLFFVNQTNGTVSLKDPFDSTPTKLLPPERSSSPDTSGEQEKNLINAGHCSTEIQNSPPCLSTPERGHCWFDFNDARVHSIHENTIQTQFAGRESTYMLFYRKKDMRRCDGVIQQPPVFPPWLAEEIQEANDKLRIEREIHDLSVNEVKITILESDHYEWGSGALQVKESVNVAPKCLSLDRRKTVGDLKTVIQENYAYQLPYNYCLHIAENLPAGLHLFDCVSDNDASTLRDVGVTDGSMLFMWDGTQVNGTPIRTGSDAQPILLHLSFLDQGEHREISHGYPRDVSMESLFGMASIFTDIETDVLQLQRMARNGRLSTLARSGTSIFREGLEDEDRLVAERGSRLTCGISPKLKDGLDSEVSLTVENRCGCQGMDHTWPVVNISINRNKTIHELKLLIVESYFNIDSGPIRLRVDNENIGLQPPLHEEQTIETVCIKKKCHMILEPGLPPKSSEITVTFALTTDSKETQTWELSMDRGVTCQKCLERAIAAAELGHSDYHLCKTNWCWEEQSILTDMTHSLEEEGVTDGDRLLLKEGRLPPKGYIRCPVWLYPTPRRGFIQGSTQDTEQAPWLQQQSEDILASLQDSSADTDITHHTLLGDLEVPQDARVEEVKLQVMTLPLLSAVSLPSMDFLRIRLIEKGRLAKVLTGSQTLKQLKVTGTSQIAVQLLSQEEKITSNMILLSICQRIPDTRTYTPMEDFSWETTNGSSPEKLRQALSQATSIPVEQLKMAKRLHEKYDWLEILSSSALAEKSKKGKKKGKPHEVNLKQSPYNIRDGDVIAIKDVQYDPLNRDDFSTEEDDIGRVKLQQEIEEKKRLRREKKNFSKGGTTPKSSRVEVGLSIKVEDFSR